MMEIPLNFIIKILKNFVSSEEEVEEVEEVVEEVKEEA